MKNELNGRKLFLEHVDLRNEEIRSTFGLRRSYPYVFDYGLWLLKECLSIYVHLIFARKSLFPVTFIPLCTSDCLL